MVKYYEISFYNDGISIGISQFKNIIREKLPSGAYYYPPFETVNLKGGYQL